MTVRERIVHQAANMFLRSGIRTVTMDDIARETGVSKRTIYENFQNKDDLLAECLDYLDGMYAEDQNEVSRNATNTIFEVLEVMKLGVKAFNTIHPLFFSDLKRYHFLIWKRTLERGQEKRKAQTFAIIKKGINQGLFRKNINIDIVATLLNEQLRIVTDEGIFPELKYPKVIVFENVVINFFRGIATQKGIMLIDKYLDEESEYFMTV